MTEQEAIKEFEERLAIADFKDDIPEYYEAMELAVKSLEEIQQYRAIGTVEECKNSVLKILEAYNKAIDDFKEELFKNSEKVRPVGWLGYSEVLTCEKIYEIAKQLKGGDGE